MDSINTTKKVLSDVLGLSDERLHSLTPETFLLGSLPELDSVAVITIILALEKNFLITIHDDEISAKTFETLGTLITFIEYKIKNRNQQNHTENQEGINEPLS